MAKRTSEIQLQKTGSRYGSILSSFTGNRKMIKRVLYVFSFFVVSSILLSSCRNINSNILFKIPNGDSFKYDSIPLEPKEDYKLGGFKMLPGIAKSSNTVNFQIIFFTMALIYSSIGIYILNLTSFIYVVGAVLLGLIFLIYSSIIIFDYSSKAVKNIFIFSIVYLPSLLLLILIDSFF